MLALKKQTAPLAPLPADWIPLPSHPRGISRARRVAEVCLFLRLNPLRAADRRLMRFLAS